jgi:hypothetical protein
VRELTRIERRAGGAAYTEEGESWIDLPLDAVVSMNMWGFTPGLFSELAARFPNFLDASQTNLLKAEYFLPSVVSALVEAGQARVRVLATGERWYGMTYIQDRPVVKAALAEMVQRGIYPRSLWQDGQP